jgi:hypothetical protein
VVPVSKMKLWEFIGGVRSLGSTMLLVLGCSLLAAPDCHAWGFPIWLPPRLFCQVASLLCPGFLVQQVLLLWFATSRYPWLQQYPLESSGVRRAGMVCRDLVAVCNWVVVCGWVAVCVATPLSMLSSLPSPGATQ